MQTFLRPQQFLALFIGLSLVSGLTIGMNKILLNLLAIQLDLLPWQIGIISGTESFAMALATLPAGAVLAIYSPRVLYLVVSCILTVIYIFLAHLQEWIIIAALMAAGGLCIAFRIVAMSSSFLQRLPQMGNHKAGWYKGSLFLGVMVLGPLLGNSLAASIGVSHSFYVSAGCFFILAILGCFVLPTSQVNKPAQGLRHVFSFRRWLPSLLAHTDVRDACLFETYASAIAAFFGAFILIIAVRDFAWPAFYGVILLVVYGMSYVLVLFGAGRLLHKKPQFFLYAMSHTLVLLGLLLLGSGSTLLLLLLGAFANGAGLGLNNLINMARVASAPVDKAHVSGVLTLGQMLGGTAGAVIGGYFGSALGLQNLFLLLALPLIARLLILFIKRDRSQVVLPK